MDASEAYGNSKKAPEVYEAADYLVYLLTGKTTRCMCHAGYKLLWNEEDGYPSTEFLQELYSPLVSLREKLKGKEVMKNIRRCMIILGWR